jgi:hypothetical protein
MVSSILVNRSAALQCSIARDVEFSNDAPVNTLARNIFKVVVSVMQAFLS